MAEMLKGGTTGIGGARARGGWPLGVTLITAFSVFVSSSNSECDDAFVSCLLSLVFVSLRPKQGSRRSSPGFAAAACTKLRCLPGTLRLQCRWDSSVPLGLNRPPQRSGQHVWGGEEAFSYTVRNVTPPGRATTGHLLWLS